jgi:hypothetical protein
MLPERLGNSPICPNFEKLLLYTLNCVIIRDKYFSGDNNK